MDEEIVAASKDGKSDIGSNKRGKRTFVLGVVDISGIKRSSVNRKRRWDQPPPEDEEEGEEEIDSEVPSKILVKENVVNETSDVDSQSKIFVDTESKLNEPSHCNSVQFPVNMDDIPLPDSSFDLPIGVPEAIEEVQNSKETLPVVLDDIPIPVDEMVPPKVLSPTVSELVKKEEVIVTNRKNSEKKSVSDMPPIKAIISDSLKQIQSCYDEDSNSSENSFVDSQAELPNKIDIDSTQGEMAQCGPVVHSKSDDFVGEKINDRSPTPVLESDKDFETIQDENTEQDLLDAVSANEVSNEPANTVNDIKKHELTKVDSSVLSEVEDEPNQPELKALNSIDDEESSSNIESLGLFVDNDFLELDCQNSVSEPSIDSEKIERISIDDKVVRSLDEKKDLPVDDLKPPVEAAEIDLPLPDEIDCSKCELETVVDASLVVGVDKIKKDTPVNEEADISKAISTNVSELIDVDAGKSIDKVFKQPKIESVSVGDIEKLGDPKMEVSELTTFPKVETSIADGLESNNEILGAFDEVTEVTKNVGDSVLTEALEIVVNEVSKEPNVQPEDANQSIVEEPEELEDSIKEINEDELLETVDVMKSSVVEDVISEQLKDLPSSKTCDDVKEEKTLPADDVPIITDNECKESSDNLYEVEKGASIINAGNSEGDLLDIPVASETLEIKSVVDNEVGSGEASNQVISDSLEAMDIDVATNEPAGETVSKTGVGSDNVGHVAPQMLTGEKEINPDCSELDLSRDLDASESTINLESSQALKMLVDESTEKETASTEAKPSNQTISIMDNSQNCVGFDDLSCKPLSKSSEINDQSVVDNVVGDDSSTVTMHFASVRAQETEDVEEEESSSAIDGLNSELIEKTMDFEEQPEMDLNTMEMLDSLVRRSSSDDQPRVPLREGLLSEDSLINEINQLPDKDDEDGKKSEGDLPTIDAITPDESNKSCSKSIPKEASTNVSDTENHDTKKTADETDVKEVAIKLEPCPSYAEQSQQGDNIPPKIAPKLKDDRQKQVKNDDSKLQLRDEEIEMADAEIVMVDPTKSLSGEDTDNDVETIPLKDESAKIADAIPNAIVDVSPVKKVLIGNEEPSSKKNKKGKHLRLSKAANKPVEFNEGAGECKMLEELKPIESKSKVDKVVAESEISSTKEPLLPVLIIKKQSLPLNKDGDKTETLTCSPKSFESADSTSKKHHELLHIETGGEALTEARSPKHSPITLRIFKDNLTVKTDLDSPKRNKSPLSSEFKSELSPHLKSPVHSGSLSPQTKQLEFTLKIAKDVATNQPKATMSPKNVASPSSIWKSEVPSPESLISSKDVEEIQVVRSGRGRGRTPRGSTRRGSGRGRRGGNLGLGKILTTSDHVSLKQEDFQERLSDVVVKQEVITDDSGTASSTASEQRTQIHDLFRQIITKESESQQSPVVAGVEPLTPVKRKRGRPRKNPLSTPVEPIVIKTEPEDPFETSLNDVLSITPGIGEPYTPINSQELDSSNDPGTSGRPKRTCRGRTKPIIVKKRKPRGGGTVGTTVPRGGGIVGTPVSRGGGIVGTPVSRGGGIVGTPVSRGGGIVGTPVSRGGSIVGTTVPQVETPIFSPVLLEIKQEVTTPQQLPDPMDTSSSSVTPSILADPSPSPAFTPPGRGRGGFKRPTPDRNTLSEKELAELQKIEAKKEKLRLDRIAKYEAKKAKKLAKKLKDEERRRRLAREKAEKAEAAAPQVFEEETRMSAPDSGSRGHTPAPNRFGQGESGIGDESQNSISTPGDTNKGNKKGRMEISITDLDCLIKEIRVDDLAEYQWQGSELYMIQEQVSLYLGVKSFKRKYPGVKRRPVEAEERTFLEDSGLVPKSMCDLGLTAVSSAEILDIMYQDFPDKYEEFRKHVRDKQAREASFKQKAAIGLQKKDGTKVEPREQALEAVAAWNANLNRERREERRCALDLQTFTVHYPKLERNNMKKPTPKLGLYPVAVIPGQFSDHFKKYTPTELMYFPINTVIYGPLKPNERHKETGSDDGSNSESSSSSSSSSSSGESSSESESEGEDPPKCSVCSGTKKKNKDSVPEILLSCFQCKACYHPSCKDMTPEMTPHLSKYEWLCTACKKCSKCTDPNLKDRIMCCQLCDRGYHLTCIGLKKMPEGRWHCSVCAYCSSCGSRSPGGSDWQHEFKKGEKGAKIYQRTLCTPCFKLWRKGKYCQLCSKCHCMKPEEDPNLIQCNSCERWLHKECYSTKYGVQSKLLSTSSIQCDVCVERIQSSVNSSPLARPLIKV